MPAAEPSLSLDSTSLDCWVSGPWLCAVSCSPACDQGVFRIHGSNTHSYERSWQTSTAGGRARKQGPICPESGELLNASFAPAVLSAGYSSNSVAV